MKSLGGEAGNRPSESSGSGENIWHFDKKGLILAGCLVAPRKRSGGERIG